METPSSTRRITRSQALAFSASNNSNLLISRKFEESETKVLKSMQKKSAEKKQQDRSALIDITNDSPIVGLAMGNLETPSSIMSKKRISGLAKYTRTPGSGEALLRGQVKTLLQKVEEEAEISKVTIENRPFFNLQGLVNSPAMISLVAPTPANTPQVLNFSGHGGLPSVTTSPVEETFLVPQVVMSDMLIDGKEEKPIQYNLVTKLDFSTLHSSDSSESSSSSILTYQGGLDSSREKQSSTDDDASSIWSIQVNASSTRDDDEEFDGFTEETEEYDYVEEDYGDIDDEYELRIVDDLCEGISKMSVTKFTGKHIRFVYNADDELQGVEEVTAAVTD